MFWSEESVIRMKTEIQNCFNDYYPSALAHIPMYFMFYLSLHNFIIVEKMYILEVSC